MRPFTAADVKGFGCRRVETERAAPRAGVRKPPRKEPAGPDGTFWGLWGFDGRQRWEAALGTASMEGAGSLGRRIDRERSGEECDLGRPGPSMSVRLAVWVGGTGGWRG